MNRLIFTGRLGKDAEKRTTPKGQEVHVFSVPCEYRTKAKTSVVWVTCNWFVDSSKNKVTQYLTKGTKVLVSGPITEEKWESKEGAPRSKLVCNVREIEVLAFKGKIGEVVTDGINAGTVEGDGSTVQNLPEEKY